MKHPVLIAVGIVVAIIVIWVIAALARPGVNPPAGGGKNYIGNSPEECARIQFICIPGTRRFDDALGCGCEPE